MFKYGMGDAGQRDALQRRNDLPIPVGGHLNPQPLIEQDEDERKNDEP